ncbi:hypothetical protein D9611_010536 [Ephemerocybe angulata]|uniref:Secreted protein n=1 Tax=Ephemerocybe angulata TaxID=980116 RepID=A0A8H5BVU9_9AGAR|nr:hypothetical protein D9611_010536 [Tulosesus angulatus]
MAPIGWFMPLELYPLPCSILRVALAILLVDWRPCAHGASSWDDTTLQCSNVDAHLRRQFTITVLCPAALFYADLFSCTGSSLCCILVYPASTLRFPDTALNCTVLDVALLRLR